MLVQKPKPSSWKMVPLVLLIVGVFGLAGWYLRGRSHLVQDSRVRTAILSTERTKSSKARDAIVPASEMVVKGGMSLGLGTGVSKRLVNPRSLAKHRASDAAHVSQPSYAKNMRSPRTFGVFIGVSHYRDRRWKSLRYAHRDACRIYEAFVRCGGLHPSRARLLLSGGARCGQATVEEVSLAAIKYTVGDWLVRNVSASDRIILFYSGHGIQQFHGTQSTLYLTAPESRQDRLFSTAISHHELQQMWRQLQARQQLIFLDACHSGWPMPKMLIPPDPIASLRSPGRVILASARGNEKAREDPHKKMGLFSGILEDALYGRADSDGDRVVDHLELIRYLMKWVPAEAKTRFQHQQHPVQWGVISGLMPVSTLSPRCQR